MVNMRVLMGEDVTFFTPQDSVYPVGTPLDPETQEPYDPTVVPLASGFASAVKHVGVYTRPVVGMEDDATANAVGWFEEGNIIFDVAPEDYESIEDATEAQRFNERYEISDADDSGVAGTIHRVLLFARQK